MLQLHSILPMQLGETLSTCFDILKETKEGEFQPFVANPSLHKVASLGKEFSTFRIPLSEGDALTGSWTRYLHRDVYIRCNSNHWNFVQHPIRINFPDHESEYINFTDNAVGTRQNWNWSEGIYSISWEAYYPNSKIEFQPSENQYVLFKAIFFDHSKKNIHQKLGHLIISRDKESGRLQSIWYTFSQKLYSLQSQDDLQLQKAISVFFDYSNLFAKLESVVIPTGYLFYLWHIQKNESPLNHYQWNGWRQWCLDSSNILTSVSSQTSQNHLFTLNSYSIYDIQLNRELETVTRMVCAGTENTVLRFIQRYNANTHYISSRKQLYDPETLTLLFDGESFQYKSEHVHSLLHTQLPSSFVDTNFLATLPYHPPFPYLTHYALSNFINLTVVTIANISLCADGFHRILLNTPDSCVIFEFTKSNPKKINKKTIHPIKFESINKFVYSVNDYMAEIHPFYDVMDGLMYHSRALKSMHLFGHREHFQDYKDLIGLHNPPENINRVLVPFHIEIKYGDCEVNEQKAFSIKEGDKVVLDAFTEIILYYYKIHEGNPVENSQKAAECLFYSDRNIGQVQTLKDAEITTITTFLNYLHIKRFHHLTDQPLYTACVELKQVTGTEHSDELSRLQQTLEVMKACPYEEDIELIYKLSQAKPRSIEEEEEADELNAVMSWKEKDQNTVIANQIFENSEHVLQLSSIVDSVTRQPTGDLFEICQICEIPKFFRKVLLNKPILDMLYFPITLSDWETQPISVPAHFEYRLESQDKDTGEIAVGTVHLNRDFYHSTPLSEWFRQTVHILKGGESSSKTQGSSSNVHEQSKNGMQFADIETDEKNNLQLKLETSSKQSTNFASWSKVGVTIHNDPCIIKIKSLPETQVVASEEGDKFGISEGFVDWIRQVVPEYAIANNPNSDII